MNSTLRHTGQQSTSLLGVDLCLFGVSLPACFARRCIWFGISVCVCAYGRGFGASELETEELERKDKMYRETEAENLKLFMIERKMRVVANEIKRLKELGLENLAEEQEEAYRELMASMWTP